jgi:flagellar FliL protein
MSEATGEAKSEAKPKKSKMMLIIIVANVLVVGGIAAYVVLGHGGESEAHAEEAAHEAPPGPEFGPLVAFEPLIVNLSDATAARYVKVTVQLEVGNEEQRLFTEQHIVPVRDRLIVYFSGLPSDHALGPAAKEAMKEELRGVINDVLGTDIIRNVYFTEFVIQ